MSDTAINVTPITRVLGMDLSKYKERHPEIQDSDGKLTYYDYDEYTLYLANEPSFPGTGLEYTNLYYGTRKVTDVIILNNLGEDPQNRLRSDIYPDDKMYLIPRIDGETWGLNGEDPLRPVGFDLYFKYHGYVTPVTTSVVAKVDYAAGTSANNYADAIEFTFNTTSGDKIVRLQSVESMIQSLTSLDSNVLQILSDQIYNVISSRIVNELSGDIATQVVTSIKNNRSLSIVNLSDGSRVSQLESKVGITSSGAETSPKSGLIKDISDIKSGIGSSTDAVTANTVYGKINKNKADIAGLSSDLDDLTHQTTDPNTSGSLQYQINTINNTTIPGINTRITNITSTLSSDEGRITALENKFTVLSGSDEDSINAIIPNLGKIKQRMGYGRDQDSDRKGSLQSQIDGLNITVEGCIDDIEDLDTRVTTLNTQVGNLNTRVDNVVADIGSDSQASTIKGKIKTLNTNVSSLDSRLTAEITRSTNKDTSHDTSISTLSTTLDNRTEVSSI